MLTQKTDKNLVRIAVDTSEILIVFLQASI